MEGFDNRWTVKVHDEFKAVSSSIAVISVTSIIPTDVSLFVDLEDDGVYNGKSSIKGEPLAHASDNLPKSSISSLVGANELLCLLITLDIGSEPFSA